MDLFSKIFSTFKFESGKDRRRVEDLFDMYMSDVPANFYENQFTLSKKYTDTEYQEWVRLLTHEGFNTWKAKQIAIIATTETDKALAGESGKDKDTLSLLKMRQDVLTAEKNVEKPTIIVMPESLFFRGGDDDAP